MFGVVCFVLFSRRFVVFRVRFFFVRSSCGGDLLVFSSFFFPLGCFLMYFVVLVDGWSVNGTDLDCDLIA